jgi:hypothetical protein
LVRNIIYFVVEILICDIRVNIRKLCSIPESEVEVTRFLSAITIDIKTKQTISIKFEDCAAILDIQNDVSVVIQHITGTKSLNMKKIDFENNYNFA